MRRLIETPGFIPGDVLNGIDGDYVYDEATFAPSPGRGRIYIQFIGESIRRIAGPALQRRLAPDKSGSRQARDDTNGQNWQKQHDRGSQSK